MNGFALSKWVRDQAFFGCPPCGRADKNSMWKLCVSKRAAELQEARLQAPLLITAILLNRWCGVAF
jgi:hypothetical protein